MSFPRLLWTITRRALVSRWYLVNLSGWIPWMIMEPRWWTRFMIVWAITWTWVGAFGVGYRRGYLDGGTFANDMNRRIGFKMVEDFFKKHFPQSATRKEDDMKPS